MAKVIKDLHRLMLAIGIVLLPLLSFLSLVSLIEKHFLASLGYGIAVFAWIYVLYQLVNTAKLLKDDKEE